MVKKPFSKINKYLLFNYLFLNEVQTITFDETGRLVSVRPFKIFRDKSDRISALKCIVNGFEEDAYYFTYNSQNQAIKIKNQGFEWASTSSYKYNKDGFVSSEYSSGEAEGTIGKTSIVYKYNKLDDFGNWTSRTWTNTYKSWDYGLDESTAYSRKESGTDRRTITYYER